MIRILLIVLMLTSVGFYLYQDNLTSQPKPIIQSKKVDKVIVKKSQHKLYLLNSGKVLREFHVVFGANPIGHKVQEGDERTPEGNYTLDYKKHNSSFFRAIHITYPNAKDKKNAKKLGVSPGGLIMIHGQKNGFESLSFFAQMFNWTDGCIALTNEDMAIVYDMVDSGIPIDIIP